MNSIEHVAAESRLPDAKERSEVPAQLTEKEAGALNRLQLGYPVTFSGDVMKVTRQSGKLLAGDGAADEPALSEAATRPA